MIKKNSGERCDDMGGLNHFKDGNATNYISAMESGMYRWTLLDSNWINLNIFKREKFPFKENFLLMEQGTVEVIVDVVACKKLCDQTSICQYFFLSKDGKCILFQSCKVHDEHWTIDGGLSDVGHTFEKGIVSNYTK